MTVVCHDPVLATASVQLRLDHCLLCQHDTLTALQPLYLVHPGGSL